MRLSVLLVVSCVLLSLTAVHAQIPLAYGEPYYQVNNSKASEVIQFGANIDYVTRPNTECQSRVDTKEHDSTLVRDARCAAKCMPGMPGAGLGAAPYYCDGFNADTDGKDSEVLCVPRKECEHLCSISDDCHSYSMRPRPSSGGAQRCFLNTFECQDKQTWDNATGTMSSNVLYEKTFAPHPECALGLGAEVRSTRYANADGLYEWKSNVTYEQLDGSHRISWHSTGCGWMLERENSTKGTCGQVCPVTNCTDDDAAANFAFFQTSRDSYQVNVCQSAAAWGAGSYCKNEVFKGLCPKTCGGVAIDVCTGDNHIGAKAALALRDISTGPMDCSNTGVTCSDPIFASMCKAKCTGARRLSSVEVMGKAPAWGDKFRQLMADISLEPTSVEGRRLAWSSEGTFPSVYEELFSTFDPFKTGGCSSTATADPLLLNKKGLFDLKLGLEPLPNVKTRQVCNEPMTYETRNDQYCPHNNIPAAFNRYPDVVKNQCKYKCGSDVTNRTAWCHGNSAAFTNNSNALCVPRETCEQLCTTVAECVSIDMHRHIPRCYLNTVGCDSLNTTGNSTMDYLVPVKRNDRNTFTTFTDRGCTGTGFLTRVEATRSTCENNCTGASNCTGFNFQRNLANAIGECTLLSGDNCGSWLTALSPLFGINGTDYVKLNRPAPCTATVESALDMEFNDEYFATTTAVGPGTYRAKDNKTQLVWASGVTGECNGWYLQKSYEEGITVSLYNCTDESYAANTFLYGTNTSIHKRFVCEWGREQGKCVNTTFAGLCSYSCGTMLNTTVGKVLYHYQDQFQNQLSNASCYGDNDQALYSFMTETTIQATSWFPVGQKLSTNWTCNDMAWRPLSMGFLVGEAPCTMGTYAPVVAALCRISCANTTVPTAAPTEAPNDEIDFLNGQNSRRLTTATFGGRMVNITYLVGEHSKWVNVYKTWANGTHDITQPESGAWYSWKRNSVNDTLYLAANQAGVACDMASVSAINSSTLYSDIIFPAHVPKDMNAQMLTVCRNASVCPELTTCVFSRSRFQDEMSMWRGSRANKEEWISMINDTVRGAMLNSTTFVPKTIVSENRAEARLVYDKWEFGRNLFRNVPGSTRYRVRNPGMAGVKLVLVQVSARAWDKTSAEVQLGRKYEAPKGYKSWKTDVLRVERFNTNGSPAEAGLFEFDVYAPGVTMLTMFSFTSDRKSMAEKLDASLVTSQGSGWFRVRAASAGRDFVGTEDVDECADDNGGCHSNADCTNNLGAVPTCACKATYTGDGKLCLLANYQYASPDAAKEYLRLYHSSAMDYGWRIKQIKLYKDSECTVEATAAAATLITTAATYPDYQSGVSFSNSNILDNSLTTEWWSECLNCNPEEVGDEFGSAGWIDFTFTETTDAVKCVKVWQDANHAATDMTLERGPVVGEDCDATAAGKRCPPSQSWTTKESTAEVVIPIGCGAANTQIFGEILVNPTTGTETGNYHDVPSECKCQALCIDHIEEGCRSWKYYAAFQHCILQSGTFSTGQGYWGVKQRTFAGWSAGDFQMDGARRVTGTKVNTGKVKPNMPFNLTVLGVGLPFHEDVGKDTSARQRMKIVGDEDDCKSPVPETVSGLVCTPTSSQVRTDSGFQDEDWHIVCVPRPGSATADSVTFHGLKIAPAKKTRKYKVCYCGGVQCHEQKSWSVVPKSEFQVAGSTFEWFTEPAVVHRRLLLADSTYGDQFVLSIKRPAFGSYSNPDNWRIRVVRTHFSCNVQTNTTIFTIADQRSGINGIDVADWNVTMDALKLTAFQTGEYYVCFSETGGAGTFLPIPSAEERFLTIHKIEADHVTPRGIFSSQYYSVRASMDNDTSVTTRIVVKGSRMIVPSESPVFINSHKSGKCGVSGNMEFDGNTFSSSKVFFPNNYHSTEEELAYDIVLENSTIGSFTLCYCNSLVDAQLNATATATVVSPANALNSSTTYKLLDDRFCKATLMPYGSMSNETSPDQCRAKCAKGCSGFSCFCDEWDPNVTPDTALCLSPFLCRKRCDAEPACTGVDVHEGKNQCYLNYGTANTVAACGLNESFVHLRRQEGLACTDEKDFTQSAGVVHITNRVHLGNEYILTPGKEGSVEVTAPEGASLTYDSFGTSKDRVMIVDCGGVCGVTSGAKSFVLPKEGTKLSTWNLFWPMGFFIDRPHNDTQNVVDIPGAAAPKKVWKYNPKPGYYCPGNNFDLALPQYSGLKRHQCYDKCALKAPCNYDDCFCDGHFSGYDGPSSNALCLNQTYCQTMCSQHDECTSYDMHKTLNRCFLNGLGCDANAHESMLGKDVNYKLVWKQEDVTDQGSVNGGSGPTGSRRMGATPRQLLAPMDKGYSWDRMLRFAPIQVLSGGTFKLCFCDSSLLQNNATCSQTKDYKVEVGKIHSSGVACLLADEEQRFTRGKCIKMYYGGMRCYDETKTAVILTPPYYESVSLDSLAFSTPTQLDTWCLYGPEEVTRGDNRCQQVAGYQSTA